MQAEKQDDTYSPEMPPVEAMGHLLGALFEVGPSMLAGSGYGPVSEQELEAWQRNQGVRLTAWESRAVRRLSKDYLDELHKAEKPDRKAPWQPEDEAPEHQVAANSMRRAIAAMASKTRG